jgi:hypothetical protein
MQTVNYILVNEAGTQNAARIINGCHLTDIGHHIVVEAAGGDTDLIRKLCHLRKHHPDAKILGISELGEYCVHPSERMNQLRCAISDLP